MKTRLGLTFGALMVASTIYAQDIALPKPQVEGGLPVNQVLAERHSVREFDANRNLPLQSVSNILWAACGINRAETGLRTNPTARNLQEIDAYWFDATGVYLYDYKENALIEKVKGDYRSLLTGTEQFRQDFVMEATGVVVLVADTAKAKMTFALIDAGIASENINLFCAGNGLATVPRMMMDVNGVQKLLSLPETSLPILNNPIGYPK